MGTMLVLLIKRRVKLKKVIGLADLHEGSVKRVVITLKVEAVSATCNTAL